MHRRDLMKATAASATTLLVGGESLPARADATLKSIGFERVTVQTADGVRLNVVETGNKHGPPILFVHGTSQSWASWIRQMADEGLRRQFRLVAVDLRGHGDSEGAFGAVDEHGIPRPLLPLEKYFDGTVAGTARLWTNDLDAVIQQLKLEQPTVVGWSFGGVVLMDYLYTHGGLGDAGRAMFVSSFPIMQPAGTVPGGLELVVTGDAIGALVQTMPTNILVSPPHVNSSLDISTGLVQFLEACLRDTVAGRPAPSSDEVMGMLGFNARSPATVRLGILSRAFDYRGFLAGLPDNTRAKMKAVVPLADGALRSEYCLPYWTDTALPVQPVADEGHACFYRNAAAFNADLAEFCAG